MTILVTGATGFVGSAVARLLIAQGQKVRLLLRPHSNRRNAANLDAEFVEGSLEDHLSLEKAVAGCQGLFHVAADYRLWVPDPAAMYRANVDGTVALMHAAQNAGVGRIVYTSSVATLGYHADGRPADEMTPVQETDMIGTYKHSKFIAEQRVRKLIADEGLPCVITHPSTPIGPRDVKPTPTGRIIIDSVKGKIPAFVDTGLNVVHVDDVAMGHWLAFEKGQIGRGYVLGGDNLALADILAMIAKEAGFAPPTIKLPRLPLYPVAATMEFIARLTNTTPLFTLDSLRMAKKKMFFSSARAESELGYTHRPAIQAIRDALAWFRQNGYC